MSALYDLLAPSIEKVPLFVSCQGAIVVMFGLVYVSKFVHAFTSLVLKGSYDNVQASYRNISNANDWKGKTISRAYNAHQNTIEAFAIFSVAMLLTLQVKGESQELEKIANTFLFIRCVYILVYLIAFNEPLGMIRSSVWTIGILLIFRIFSIAVGDKFYK